MSFSDEREAWLCQSVGYLRDEPVDDATFSSDGSLLAVVYGKVKYRQASILLKSLLPPFPTRTHDAPIQLYCVKNMCVLLKYAPEWITVTFLGTAPYVQRIIVIKFL